MKRKVAVVVDADSEIGALKAAARLLEDFGVACEEVGKRITITRVVEKKPTT